MATDINEVLSESEKYDELNEILGLSEGKESFDLSQKSASYKLIETHRSNHSNRSLA
jgi:hypothetical protein